MVITGFCTTFLNCCLFSHCSLSHCLSDSPSSCTITPPSTFVCCGIWLPSPPFSHHFSFHLPYPTCFVFSHIGFLLSPLFSAFTSSGSLWPFCLDGKSLNAMLEMIRPLRSCSGGVFFVTFFIIPSNTLHILFFLSGCVFVTA